MWEIVYNQQKQVFEHLQAMGPDYLLGGWRHGAWAHAKSLGSTENLRGMHGVQLASLVSGSGLDHMAPIHTTLIRTEHQYDSPLPAKTGELLAGYRSEEVLTPQDTMVQRADELCLSTSAEGRGRASPSEERRA